MTFAELFDTRGPDVSASFKGHRDDFKMMKPSGTHFRLPFLATKFFLVSNPLGNWSCHGNEVNDVDFNDVCQYT
jgi:hypothetical protein